MSTIHRMLLRAFLAVLLVAILFFVLVVQLLDLFGNLWRYLAHDTASRQILAIAWLYREDYAAGGFRMLPIDDPAGDRTSAMVLLGKTYENLMVDLTATCDKLHDRARRISRSPPQGGRSGPRPRGSPLLIGRSNEWEAEHDGEEGGHRRRS